MSHTPRRLAVLGSSALAVAFAAVTGLSGPASAAIAPTPRSAGSLTGTLHAPKFGTLQDVTVAACTDVLCHNVVSFSKVADGAHKTAASFTLANLPAGDYYVNAFIDYNHNNNPDCSYYGCNDFHTPYITADGNAVVRPPRTGIDITLPS